MPHNTQNEPFAIIPDEDNRGFMIRDHRDPRFLTVTVVAWNGQYVQFDRLFGNNETTMAHGFAEIADPNNTPLQFIPPWTR